MENKDIHKNFNHPDLRDFLSKELKKAQQNWSGQSIRDLEEEIERIKIRIEATKNYEVLRNLIASQGWEEFDISDEIIDYEFPRYFPFIGSEEDYEKLMTNIEKI